MDKEEIELLSQEQENFENDTIMTEAEQKRRRFEEKLAKEEAERKRKKEALMKEQEEQEMVRTYKQSLLTVCDLKILINFIYWLLNFRKYVLNLSKKDKMIFNYWKVQNPWKIQSRNASENLHLN